MNHILLQKQQLRPSYTATIIRRKATTTTTTTTGTNQNHYYYHQWKKRRPYRTLAGGGIAAAAAVVVGYFLTEEEYQKEQQNYSNKEEEEDSKGYINEKKDSFAFLLRSNPLLQTNFFISSPFPFQMNHHQQHYFHLLYPHQSMMMKKTLCEEEQQHQVQGGGTASSETTTKGRGRFGFITSWWRKKPRDEKEDDNNTTTTNQEEEEEDGGDDVVIQKSRTKRMLLNLKSKKETVEDKYDIDWRSVPIGEGAFGTVYEAYCRKTGEKVAIKKEPKAVVDNPDFEMEMEALLLLKEKGGHKNICALRENFETSKSFLIVFDYIAGKELFEYLCESGIFQPNSQETARHIYDIVSALDFLHSIGIVHADLKCENIMLSSSARSSSWDKVSGKMTVIDFGNAHILTDTTKLFKDGRRRVTSRSPSYCPPEVLRELNDNIRDQEEDRLAHINPSFDMWSLGIVIYIMLVGMHPFDIEADGTSEEIQDRILSPHVYKIPLRGSPATRHLSEDCIDLIEGLLEYDPNKRLTAEQVLEHPWVKKGANSNMQSHRRRVYGQWPKKKNNQ